MDLLLNPTSHDIVFRNWKCDVTYDQQDVVAQRLKIKLSTFLGEWFLDTSIGIPYFEEVLVKGFDKQSVDALFQTAIVEDSGVLELISYNSYLESSTRKFYLSFAVRVATDSVVPIDFTLLLGG